MSVECLKFSIKEVRKITERWDLDRLMFHWGMRAEGDYFYIPCRAIAKLWVDSGYFENPIDPSENYMWKLSDIIKNWIGDNPSDIQKILNAINLYNLHMGKVMIEFTSTEAHCKKVYGNLLGLLETVDIDKD